MEENSSTAVAVPFDPARLSRAALDVLAERARHKTVEGWHEEHDDAHHDSGSLATAAACYALGAREVGRLRGMPAIRLWPWDDKWWKPKDRRRDLVRAGSLILAEIERLDRVNPPAAAVATEEQGSARSGEEPPSSPSRERVEVLEEALRRMLAVFDTPSGFGAPGAEQETCAIARAALGEKADG